jgi:thiosulfate dehydrogenase [quinone] large subunit
MTSLVERNTTITAPTATPAAGETTRQKATRYILAGLRLSLGWIFLWAFMDKLWGLGHETASAKSWLNGGSPTKGFLSGSKGPFESFYHNIAGAGWANWLFMLALLGIGIALILGIGMRIAAAAGALLMVLMWSASLPPENNVFMDDHIIYAGLIVVLALTAAGDTWGFGKAWAKVPFVKSLPWLK